MGTKRDNGMTLTAPRVLIVTDEATGPLMTEAAIRAWELASVLVQQFPTTLAAPGPHPAEPARFAFASIPPASEGVAALTEMIRAHDVIVAQALPLAALPTEGMAGKYLIIDLHRPWALNRLAAPDSAAPHDPSSLAADLIAVNQLLGAGDFFVCATEQQRALWLGALLQAGRLTEGVAGRASDARALLDVVPFGVPAIPPQKRERTLKGVVPGIGPNDFVALWNGGLWQSLDPLTLVTATARLRDAGYPVRSVFLNTHRPDEPEPPLLTAARERSDELELIGEYVFFPEAWAPYAARADYLLEADACVSLAQPTLDARLTVRAAVLDALWAGVVPVVGENDALADLLRTYDAGRVVPVGDDAALTLTLAHLIDNPYERRLLAGQTHALGQSFTWDGVAQPLIAFCRQPLKGERVPGFIAAELQERVNELERTLFQTSTYAERLERELAARGGPNLAAPAGERGMGALLRRAMGGRRPERHAPSVTPPTDEQAE